MTPYLKLLRDFLYFPTKWGVFQQPQNPQKSQGRLIFGHPVQERFLAFIILWMLIHTWPSAHRGCEPVLRLLAKLNKPLTFGSMRPSSTWLVATQTLFMFIPNLGEDEPILTSIFSRWVGSTTNQQYTLALLSSPNFSQPDLFKDRIRWNRGGCLWRPLGHSRGLAGGSLQVSKGLLKMPIYRYIP